VDAFEQHNVGGERPFGRLRRGGPDDFSEHGAGLDAHQLERVADQHECGVGTHSVEQTGHQRE